MKITFSSTTSTERYRYLYTYWQLLKGNYGNKMFFIIPKLTKQLTNDKYNCVILPEISYSFSPAQIVELSKIDNMQDFNSLALHNSPLINLDLNSNFINKSSSIKKDWEQKQQQFINLLKLFFDANPFINYEINIHITQIGSLGSYHIINKNKSILYIREDTGTWEIAELLISLLVRNLNNDLNYMKNLKDTKTWLITEGVSNFLLKHTTLNNLFPDFIETRLSDNSISIKTLTISQNYMKKLNLNPKDKLTVKNENIYNGNKRILGLSPQETQLLTGLLHQKDTLLTLEDIAKILWKDQYLEKFSLYAINKVIHHLRYKLKLNGVYTSTIRTVRGKGYVLN